MIDWIKIVRRRRVRQKAAAYPEYVAILHVARALGRPVKWCDERADSFLLDQQGRGTVVDAELALDQAGNFLCGLARDPLPDGRATCQRHGSEVATPMPPSGVRTLRAGVNPCRDQLAEGRLIPGRWLAACTRLPAPPDQ
jgi:Molybdopterin-binding domain of aldehyde dehydrogenase